MMWLLAAAPAWACGTFVGEEPVQQTGERVLFRQDGPDEWTAFVEVEFSGGGANTPFSWIIPVREGFDLDTDVSVANSGLFDALEMVTSPRFLAVGDSLVPEIGSLSCASVAGSVDPVAMLFPETDDRYLLGSSVVGPYSLELIDGTDANLLVDWMLDQGYNLPAGIEDPIQAYVDEGYDFLGVQLSSTAQAGLVDTLVLGCGMTEPTVPLKLTGLGAVQDMSITAYVLGDERVSPSGVWKEVKPDLMGILNNEAYEERLRVDQELAGGQAFTVEYASPAPDLLALLDRDAAETLGHGAYLTRLRAFVDPADMDNDPVFVNDPKAGDVDPILRPGLSAASVPVSGGLLLGVLVGAGFLRRR